MRICITGGAGFVGSHLAQRLVTSGHTVTILDNLESGKATNLSAIKSSIQFIKGDVRNNDALRGAIEGAEYVFHLAGKVTVSDSYKDTNTYHEVNVGATRRLLSLAKKAHVRKVIFSSSAAVYGNTNTLPICERTTTPIPISPLGKTKLAAEKLCLAARNSGLQTVILRFFNIYGDHQNPAFSGVISAFMKTLKGEKTAKIYGDGTQLRDFIYIDDVIDACILAISADTSSNHLFNVGTGKGITVNQLLNHIAAIQNISIHPKYLPPKPGDIKQSVACTCQASQHLRFTPKIAIKKGLKKLLSHEN